MLDFCLLDNSTGVIRSLAPGDSMSIHRNGHVSFSNSYGVPFVWCLGNTCINEAEQNFAGLSLVARVDQNHLFDDFASLIAATCGLSVANVKRSKALVLYRFA